MFGNHYQSCDAHKKVLNIKRPNFNSYFKFRLGLSPYIRKKSFDFLLYIKIFFDDFIIIHIMNIISIYLALTQIINIFFNVCFLQI